VNVLPNELDLTAEDTANVTHRGWVTAALLLCMFMTAIEITIVATAVPRIVAELGGFALMSWVFSAYLLTQVVSIPIYGKLADIFGRKPVFLTGVALFLIGSVLCGKAETMTQLIAFRFLQGIGGGAVQPIAVTITGDLYPPAERPRVQGLFGSVFAISSIAGPTLGALIVDHGHWSWIFYLNVPLGILSCLVLSIFLHEKKMEKKPSIDYVGAVLLIIGASALMITFLQGGTAWPWFGWQSLTLFMTFAICCSSLIIWEGKVSHPILPLWIFKHRLIVVAGIATFLNGALLIGFTATIPTHVQGVLGETALVAGIALGAMSIGWPIASYASGVVMRHVGYRKTAIIGAFTVIAGAIGLVQGAHTSAIAVGAAVFVTGLGLGLQSSSYMITIQSAVSWSERGVATANNLFMRTLGSTVGVAAFGAILNSAVYHYLTSVTTSVKSKNVLDLVNKLLDPQNTQLTALDRANVIAGLDIGMSTAFLFATSLAVLNCILAFVLPSSVVTYDEKKAQQVAEPFVESH
jgi:EmrB/QacA subfamily drug resistance transporter